MSHCKFSFLAAAESMHYGRVVFSNDFKGLTFSLAHDILQNECSCMSASIEIKVSCLIRWIVFINISHVIKDINSSDKDHSRENLHRRVIKTICWHMSDSMDRLINLMDEYT